jgi:hypothetical protein
MIKIDAATVAQHSASLSKFVYATGFFVAFGELSRCGTHRHTGCSPRGTSTMPISATHAVPLSGSQNLCSKQLDRPSGGTPPFRDPSFAELCLFRDHHTPHHQPVNPRSLQALPQASRPKPGLSTMAFASPFRLFVTLICRADSLSSPAIQLQSPIAATK